jgi:hypothetical protein
VHVAVDVALDVSDGIVVDVAAVVVDITMSAAAMDVAAAAAVDIVGCDSGETDVG